MPESAQDNTLSEAKRILDQMRKDAGEDWALTTGADTAFYREGKNESKRIIVSNHSSMNVGQILPWPEILVFEPDGQKACYQMTRAAWGMVGIVEGYDRLAYEATKERRIVVTVWKNRMEINARGSRKQRKQLKNKALRMMERQVSAYYGVTASLRFWRGKNAYTVCLQDTARRSSQ